MDDTTLVRFEAAENPFATPIGFDLRSDYMADCYGPALGPSCVVLARRLAQLLEDSGGQLEVPAAELAWSIGVKKGFGTSSPLARTLRRLGQGRVLYARNDTLAVFTALPPLSQRVVDRKLPPWSRERHRELVGRALDDLQAALSGGGRVPPRWQTPPARAGLGGRSL